MWFWQLWETVAWRVQSDGRFVGSSQTAVSAVPVRRLLVGYNQMVGELATVEFVTVGDGLAALQFLTAPQRLTAPNNCPSVVAPDGG